MAQRGVVVGATVQTRGGESFYDGKINPENLKQLLLYWDKLSYATFNGIGPNFSSVHDLEYLNQVGILSIDEIKFKLEEILPPEKMGGPEICGLPWNYIGDIQVGAQMKLAQKLSQDGSIWTVAQFGDSLMAPNVKGAMSSILEFTLANCLPIPSNNVSIEDILDFRAKYRNELMSLRIAFDEIRSDIITSDDPARAISAYKEKIEHSVNCIGSAMQSSKFGFRLDTLKAFVEAKPSTLIGALAGGVVGQSISTPIVMSGLGWAGAAAISIACRYALGVEKIPDALKEFSYVYRAQDEFTR